jgi:hypothetical protein
MFVARVGNLTTSGHLELVNNAAGLMEVPAVNRVLASILIALLPRSSDKPIYPIPQRQGPDWSNDQTITSHQTPIHMVKISSKLIPYFPFPTYQTLF